jgi:aspartyl-tRNA(Asn)/glutamyl-tRNA(Gln) amidotransferase subunit A
MKDIFDLSALEIGAAIKSREIGVAELTRAALRQAADTPTNAFITICEEEALARAELVQSRVDGGEATSPLAGVPAAIKDNISTKGIRTTCASRILDNYIPMYDATAVERLYAADAVIIGKLNMDEFAMGSTNETSAFGAVRNPWDGDRCPGGSSGGAAAAVAARIIPYALGSDTGGSIRQPAAFCGVTGLKPTYGAVSRWGLIAYGSSLDQIGPLARDARDCAAILAALSGEADARDGTSVRYVPEPPPQCAGQSQALDDPSLKGLRVALPREAFERGLSGDVRDATLAAAKTLETLGAVVEWIPFPMFEYAVAAYYIIASAEAASNLSRYDGIRYGRGVADVGLSLEEAILRARGEGFGREVKRRLMLGNFVLSAGYYDAYYNKALQAKALLCDAFREAFGRFDMMLTPTAPSAALRLGENLDDPLAMYMGDVYTVPVNIAGLPALSLPCGFSNGLPIGAQFIGAQFADAALLRAGAAYQSATDHHKRKPGADGRR